MIGIDLSGKTALVTGVADNVGFAWHIAKALKAAGAKIVLQCHPRVTGIVQRFLTRDKDAPSRTLPFGVDGEFQVAAMYPCDVSYDTAADIPDDVRNKKGYRDVDPSISGAFAAMQKDGHHVDILIHAVAFSPEVQIPHLEVSRAAYLTATSVSAYSLIALTRAALPLMQDRAASVVGLSYYAAQRVIPAYGGGMASAKAALESDARNLSYFVGEFGHRVNIVSAGPYGSRAARSIGDIQAAIDHCASVAPLKRAITADEVANAVLFFCSPLATGVTGQCLYVDAGFNIMGG